MRTNAISTLTLWNTPRTGAARIQSDIAQANKEVITGRYADVGLQLGGRVSLSVGLRQKSAELIALKDGNAVTASRLIGTQGALKVIREAADASLATLTGLPPSQRAGAIADTAKINLTALTASLGTSAADQYVFGGTNTQQVPVRSYGGTPTSAAKTAIDTAFFTAFGMAQDAAGVNTISAADMTTFLDGAFATEFDLTNWKANWSVASDTTLDSQISLTDTVETSTTANGPAMRKLAMAYVMASDLGLSKMSAEVQSVVTEKVMHLLSEASSSLVTTQANLGRSQAAITAANTRMDAQNTVLGGEWGQLENVDRAEAKTRLDLLTTQVQISYSLTSQLRQLSLVNYL